MDKKLFMFVLLAIGATVQGAMERKEKPKFIFTRFFKAGVPQILLSVQMSKDYDESIFYQKANEFLQEYSNLEAIVLPYTGLSRLHIGSEPSSIVDSYIKFSLIHSDKVTHHIPSFCVTHSYSFERVDLEALSSVILDKEMYLIRDQE